MKFFTYDYGNWKAYQWPYLILKIKNYLKLKKKDKYSIILIDPGVYELGDSDHFSWEGKIDIDEFLDSLPDNHYFSFDYPGDMNPKFTDIFLKKSWDNAKKYSKHPQYITTVQYRFNNYLSFIEWFDDYNELTMTSNIMGLGNICKQKGCNSFLKHALPYAFKNSKANWIHIYGANLFTIPYIDKLGKMFNKKVSVDNRKWEYYRKSSERPYWFKEYIKKIECYLN